jgi:hypothetical protein
LGDSLFRVVERFSEFLSRKPGGGWPCCLTKKRLSLSRLVMSTTDQLEVSRSKNNSDLAFAGTMWVHLETTSTLAALVAAATMLTGTHYLPHLLPPGRGVGAVVRLFGPLWKSPASALSGGPSSFRGRQRHSAWILPP